MNYVDKRHFCNYFVKSEILSLFFLKMECVKVISTRLFSPIYRTQVMFNAKFSTELQKKIVSPLLLKKHKSILESVQWELGIKSWEDWYNIKVVDVDNVTNTGFLKNYTSLAQAIIQFFPEHPWNLYKFSSLTLSFWKDPKNQRVKYFLFILIKGILPICIHKTFHRKNG